MSDFNTKTPRKNTLHKKIKKMKYNKSIEQLDEEITERFKKDREMVPLLEELLSSISINAVNADASAVNAVLCTKEKLKKLESDPIVSAYLDLHFLKKELCDKHKSYYKNTAIPTTPKTINQLLKMPNTYNNVSILYPKLKEQISSLDVYTDSYLYKHLSILSLLLYSLVYERSNGSNGSNGSTYKVKELHEYIILLKNEHYYLSYRDETLYIFFKLEQLKIDNKQANTEQSDLMNDTIKELTIQYYSIIRLQYTGTLCLSLKNVFRCTTCEGVGGTTTVYVSKEKDSLCDGCGLVLGRYIDSTEESLGYNELQTYERVTKFDYEKINYFTELLNKAQGFHSSNIPDDIITKILLELKKSSNTTISYDNIRNILKTIRASNYYDMIPSIIYKISGKPPMLLAPEIQEKLKAMFKQIQIPWESHKDIIKDRKSGASYKYIFYKFFELLNLKEYLVFFPLLKSTEKRHKLDIVWKKIIEDLSPSDPELWVFYPSD
ncbi:hypothetical protein CCP3SC1AL1_1100011 [Gammaproteobacteria bacterium]